MKNFKLPVAAFAFVAATSIGAHFANADTQPVDVAANITSTLTIIVTGTANCGDVTSLSDNTCSGHVGYASASVDVTASGTDTASIDFATLGVATITHTVNLTDSLEVNVIAAADGTTSPAITNIDTSLGSASFDVVPVDINAGSHLADDSAGSYEGTIDVTVTADE